MVRVKTDTEAKESLGGHKNKMMNNIEQIVLKVLENNSSKCLDNAEERELVAVQVSIELLQQSLQQLAGLTGGELLHDDDGQAIIYTGIHNPNYDRNCMKRTDPFELV